MLDAQDVDILRVRVQVLVESLIHIAKTTDSEHYSQFLFWVSCGLMEASPLTHPAVYNCGVNLLGAVVVCLFILNNIECDFSNVFYK
jgi:hypothetical protein